MRIVLDTNVLVSGLLTPYGPPGEIVRMASSGAITLCLDARILAEYAEVLSRPKFGFDADAVAALLDQLEYTGWTTAAEPLPLRLPDPDDEPFLEVALSGAADALVTGNIADFPAERCGDVVVLTPAGFIERYRGSIA
ncbi:MAG: putative toxin-antitoxin system toxin component, PIN family [Coriobacteriia bacterium]|nr:putative toxin-antitoxin system toxin component, PIN family [Coriobacteriia bacterium]